MYKASSQVRYMFKQVLKSCGLCIHGEEELKNCQQWQTDWRVSMYNEMNTMDTIQKQFLRGKFKRHNRNLFSYFNFNPMKGEEAFLFQIYELCSCISTLDVNNHFNLHYLHELNLFKRRIGSQRFNLRFNLGVENTLSTRPQKAHKAESKKEWTELKGLLRSQLRDLGWLSLPTKTKRK